MGDKVLIAAAGRLTGALRKSDTVARMGGDEFVLLLGEIDDKDNAVNVGEKILEDFRRPFLIDGHSLSITISMGIAIYPESGGSVEELLKSSDRLMYSAKQNGGNRFAI
jgi:diguanylate cyclase (GGDEF)-like protein